MIFLASARIFDILWASRKFMARKKKIPMFGADPDASGCPCGTISSSHQALLLNGILPTLWAPGFVRSRRSAKDVLFEMNRLHNNKAGIALVGNIYSRVEEIPHDDLRNFQTTKRKGMGRHSLSRLINIRRTLRAGTSTLTFATTRWR
jgi:hypothetical protein